ncbi:Arc family DNA-binding protein [Devosia indica]
MVVKPSVCHWCVMARDDLHFRLRIPDELKTKIEAAAAKSRRSMTAEIVARLEEYEALELGEESLTSFVQRQQKEIDTLKRSGIKLPNGLWYRVDHAATRRQRSVQEEVVQALEQAYPAPVVPELDELGYYWYWKYADAAPEEREGVLKEANADLKSKGLEHEFWPGEPHENGTPTLKLGIRHFGPKADQQ